MNQSCIQRGEKVAAAAVPRVLIFHSCANFCFCFHAVFILFCLFCAIFVIFVNKKKRKSIGVKKLVQLPADHVYLATFKKSLENEK